MAPQDSIVTVRISLDGDFSADDVTKALTAEGGQIPDVQPESVTAIVVASIAVVGLAKAIKSLWDDCQQGVIVDTRGADVVVRKDPNLPRGTVVVINRSGVETKVQQPDHDSLTDLIDAALAASA